MQMSLADELYAQSTAIRRWKEKEEYDALINEIKLSAAALTNGEMQLTFARSFSPDIIATLRAPPNNFIVTENHYKGRPGCGCDHGCEICSSKLSTTISWDRSKKATEEKAKKEAPPGDATFPKCTSCGSVVGTPMESEFEGTSFCCQACVGHYRNYGAFTRRAQADKPSSGSDLLP